MAQRVFQIKPLCALSTYQVDENFGIGFAGKHHACRFKLCSELRGVFNNAVMDERDGAAYVGVSIGIGRFTVGCPTGVADPHIARQLFR